MLASTLIKLLQKQIAEHGDLPVMIGHPKDPYPIRCKLSGVDHIHTGSKSIPGPMYMSFSAWPDCVRLKVRSE